jgi:hypothetical protein
MEMSTHYELARGPIESMAISKFWSVCQEYQAGLACLTKFGISEDVSIRVLENLRPLSDEGAEQFKQLLEERQLDNRRELSPKTIIQLTEVLGARQAGDNQFTNVNKYPDKQAPVFKLIRAQLIKIGPQPLLEVEGIYLDQAGEPSEYYHGVFCPGNRSYKFVLEIFLVSFKRREFLAEESTFLRFLKAIHWSKDKSIVSASD